MHAEQAAYNLAQSIKAQGVPPRALSMAVNRRHEGEEMIETIRIRLASPYNAKVHPPATYEGYAVEVQPWSKAVGLAR